MKQKHQVPEGDAVAPNPSYVARPGSRQGRGVEQHVSVQTTERYLGCKQRIRSAVNDRIGIEPNP
jgi:hypothetical protein